MMPVILSLDTVELTDEQFWRLCQQNRDFQLERSARGELIVMSPVGGKSGNQEADLITDLSLWNRQT
ncbi:MAG: Uma2 family endonuclease, partial [Cyanobacteria bacterium J06628_3]